MARETISLNAFFDDIKEELKQALKENQKIVVDFAQPELNFQTDPRILRGVLFNLLSNASKYSDPGKVITLEATYTKNRVIFKVKDEGLGIPKTDIKHIFDRFFRASNVSNIQGTGLGLNIVKRYIDLLKGDITFTSEEGKGSSFIITLPIE